MRGLVRKLAVGVVAAFTSGIAVAGNYVSTPDLLFGQDTGTSQCRVDSITVTETTPVIDLDLGLIVDHDWRLDTRVRMQSPAGTLVTPVNGPATATAIADYNILLSDDAVPPGTTTPPVVNNPGHGPNDWTAAPYQTVVSPNNALSAYIGENPQGTWFIEVCDQFPTADDGILRRWELRFEDPPAAPDLQLQVAASSQQVTAGTDVTFTLELRNTGAQSSTGTEAVVSLPAGFAYQSHTAPAGTNYNSATGVWTLGTVAGSSIQTLTVVATINATGVLEAEVTAASGTDPDSTPGNGQNAEDDSDAISVAVSTGGVGTAPTLVCDARVGTTDTTPNVLNWDLPSGTFGWTSGSTAPRSYYQSTTDGVPEIRISYGGATSALTDVNATVGASPVTDTTLTGGNAAPDQEGLHLAVQYASLSEANTSPIRVIFEFGEAIGGGSGANGSGGVVIPVYDVDLGGWTDRIEVIGSIEDGTGASITRTPSFTTSASNFLEFRNGTYGVTGSADSASTSANGNMWIKFDESIDRLEIIYGNVSSQNPPAFQFISIGNISYCDPENSDLSAVKSVESKTSGQYNIPGESILYRITATSGTDANLDAEGIEIKDTLPDNLRFVSATATGFTGGSFASPALPAANTDCAGGACVISFTNGTLTKGTSGEVVIEAVIK